MKKTVIVLGYIVAVIVAAALGLDGWIKLAILVAVTILFVVAFVARASGSAGLALSIVAALTILCPVVALLFIGAPAYASWEETFKAIVDSSREHGVLSGFEWFAPLAAACAGLVVARHVRSNQPLHATHEDARA